MPARPWVPAIAASALAQALASAPAHARQSAPTVPLCAGLTIVGAVSEPKGDYESILRIDSIDERAVHAKLSTDVVTSTGVRHVRVMRTVLKEDLEASPMLAHWFDTRAPITIKGSTAFGTSRSVLRSLRETGAADLALVDREGSSLPADPRVQPNIYDYRKVYKLERVAGGRATLPVTVNGEAVELPVLYARGELMGDRIEIAFLDDDANPLRLRFKATPYGSSKPDTESQVVKIAHRCTKAAAGARAPGNRIEQALLETGRVDVYDIYFDFNSDRIREESAPTLEEIAQVMRRHPEWKLAIEGHTDSIGSDAVNLELSRRRAASVSAALVAAHSIAAVRLKATGVGEGRPRDRNDTFEGRARNRRVELARIQ